MQGLSPGVWSPPGGDHSGAVVTPGAGSPGGTCGHHFFCSNLQFSNLIVQKFLQSLSQTWSRQKCFPSKTVLWVLKTKKKNNKAFFLTLVLKWHNIPIPLRYMMEAFWFVTDNFFYFIFRTCSSEQFCFLFIFITLSCYSSSFTYLFLPLAQSSRCIPIM